MIANALDPNQFDVFFIYFCQGKGKKEKREGFSIYSIQVHNSLRKFGRPYFLYYPAIRKILYDERPDIVYRRGGTGSLGILCQLRKKIGFRLVWACAHISELTRTKRITYKTIFTYLDDLVCAYGIRHADRIVTQTRDQRRLLQKNYGRDSVICRNAHPFSEGVEQKKTEEVLIVWIANFKYWKQPEQFVRLAERCQDLDNARFVMIGRKGYGKFWDDLEIRINALDSIEHKGEMPQKDVNHVLDRAHIFVNTSLHEGFPNTFIQSWMRGVPVVSLHVDPDKMLETEKIGFYSKTFYQFVKNTRFLIQNSAVRYEMGRRARSYAASTFSLRNINTLVKLFRDLERK